MKIIKNSIKAVIFDMDGTIINTEHHWKRATKTVLKKRGVQTFTPQQKEILEKINKGIGLHQGIVNIKEAFNLDDSVETLIQEKKDHVAKLFMANKPSFIDGFEAFVTKLLKHGIRICIATNADDDSLTQLSNLFNFPDFFGSKIYGISRVNNKAKPDPAIFLYAAKQLGVKPEECIVFEDSPVGFQAAQAAGIRCIAIKNEANHDKLHEANVAITSFFEAEQQLKELAQQKTQQLKQNTIAKKSNIKEKGFIQSGIH